MWILVRGSHPDRCLIVLKNIETGRVVDATAGCDWATQDNKYAVRSGALMLARGLSEEDAIKYMELLAAALGAVEFARNPANGEWVRRDMWRV